jgi:hypothetical protein
MKKLVIISASFFVLIQFFFSPMVFAQVDLTDFVPDEEGAASGSFTLDQDGTAGAGDIIQIEFGSTLAEFLQFDVDDDRFEISNDLSLEGFELETFRIENLGSDPVACSAPVSGRMYYSTASNALQVCDGTAWGTVGSGGGASVDQTNLVYVDTARSAQAGEVYSTLAAAVGYINTQSPGVANRWVILIESATNTESVTLPTYTVLAGRDRQSSILTGTIVLSASSALQGVTVNSTGEVDIPAATTGYISDSDVIIDDGALAGIDGTLVVHDSFIDGEISATGAVMAYNSLIGPTGLINDGTIATYHSTVLTLTNNSIWNNFASAFNSAASGLSATTTQAAIDELRTSNTFTIDSDDGGTDQVQLNFGTPEFFLWDDVNDYFFLSDALVVDGNVNIQGTILRLDSDELGDPDQNLDIVAEQGSESDGTIRYDDGNNRWEISNNGGAFSAIATGSGVVATDLAGVQSRRTTNYTLTNAFVDIALDTTDFENEATVIEHNNSNIDDIDIKEDGVYLVTWRAQTEVTGGSALVRSFGRVRIDDSTVIAGSETEVNTWYTAQSYIGAQILVSLTNGNKLTLQLSKETTADAAVATADTVFSVVKMEGIEGPQGPAGTGNTLDAAYDQGGAGQGRTITIDSGAFDLQGTGELLELGDGSAADSYFNFDDGSDRQLGWDDSADSFYFGDDVNIHGSVLTLDADEAANPDTNIDIIAEQGSESNGVLRYDDGNNRWEISNDGTNFEAINISSVLSAYDSNGGVTLSTTQTVAALDQEHVSDSAYTHSAGTVTINLDGLYKVSGWVTAIVSNNAGNIRNNLVVVFQDASPGPSFTDVSGARCQDYVREQNSGSPGASCFVTYIKSYNNTDQLRLTHFMDSTSNDPDTVANASGMTIELIRPE